MADFLDSALSGGLDRALERWFSVLNATRGRRVSLGGLVSPGLIVLDPMRLFCDPSSPAFLPSYPLIESRLFSLVDTVLAAGFPVIFSRHAHPNNDEGGLIARFFGRLQRCDDLLNELVPEALSRIPPAVQHLKCRHSAFHSPELERVFANCDSLLITGVQSHLCVLATALDSSRHHLVPIVVADACGARDEETHLSALRVMAGGHAHIVSAAEAETFIRRVKNAITRIGDVDEPPQPGQSSNGEWE